MARSYINQFNQILCVEKLFMIISAQIAFTNYKELIKADI